MPYKEKIMKQILIILLMLTILLSLMGCNKNTNNQSDKITIWDNIVNKEWSNYDSWAGTGLYFYEEDNNRYCIYMVYGSGVPVAYHFISDAWIEEDKVKVLLPINIEIGKFNAEPDEKEVEEVIFKFEDNAIKHGDLKFGISDLNSIDFIR